MVRAGTSGDIGPLNNWDIIDRGCKINIRADVACPGSIRSVVFRLNGNSYRIENAAPYALAGDASGSYYQLNLSSGNYHLVATPWSGLNGTGAAGISYEIWFTVTTGSSRSCITNNNNNNYGFKMGGTEEDKVDYEISVFPNPNRGEFNVKFDLPEAGDVRVALYDFSGKLIYEDRKLSFSGNYLQRVDIQSQAMGVYLLAVTINDKIKTEKIVYSGR